MYFENKEYNQFRDLENNIHNNVLNIMMMVNGFKFTDLGIDDSVIGNDKNFKSGFTFCLLRNNIASTKNLLDDATMN